MWKTSDRRGEPMDVRIRLDNRSPIGVFCEPGIRRHSHQIYYLLKFFIFIIPYNVSWIQKVFVVETQSLFLFSPIFFSFLMEKVVTVYVRGKWRGCRSYSVVKYIIVNRSRRRRHMGEGSVENKPMNLYPCVSDEFTSVCVYFQSNKKRRGSR